MVTFSPIRLPGTNPNTLDILNNATQRLDKARSQLSKAKKELSAQKTLMKTARFTPAGYKKATAKLEALQKKVDTLTAQVKRLTFLAHDIA